MKLRYYQEKAIAAVWDHVRTRQDNPVVVIPTGGGKTPVIAKLCQDVVGWSGRVACVTHVKELIKQNFDHLSGLIPDSHIGVYSAGLESRDTDRPITVAGIQSIYNRAEEFGKLDVVIVDEAHRIPEDGEGMYRTFLQGIKAVNPRAVLIGLTATPYRMGSGMLCKSESLLNKVVYEIGVRELIVKGFLSPLKSKATAERTDLSKVTVRGGEYVPRELQAAMMEDEYKVANACLEIVTKTEDRRSVLVFCTGVDHAKTVAKYLQEIEANNAYSASGGSQEATKVRMIFGDTDSYERAQTIADFRSGRVKYLVNVDVLTTGFDAPGVDCVAILRPTLSPGLFYQMVGRGFRIADGKKDCLILDFGNNLFVHGPVDRMMISEDKKTGQATNGGARFKECPACSEVVLRSCDVCLDCGHVFDKSTRGVGHDARSSEGEVLSGPEKVAGIAYSKHEKKTSGLASTGPKKPPSMRVDYYCGLMAHTPAEFVCFEHDGFARVKAVKWWKARSGEPVPSTVDEALRVIATKGILEPKKVILKSDKGYLKPDQYLEMEFKAAPEVVLGIVGGLPGDLRDDKAFADIPF